MISTPCVCIYIPHVVPRSQPLLRNTHRHHILTNLTSPMPIQLSIPYREISLAADGDMYGKKIPKKKEGTFERESSHHYLHTDVNNLNGTRSRLAYCNPNTGS